MDDLFSAKEDVIVRIETITCTCPTFYRLDGCDKDSLRKVFANHHIDAVIHFAGYKAVGEGVKKPLAYYRNNIDSTLALNYQRVKNDKAPEAQKVLGFGSFCRINYLGYPLFLPDVFVLLSFRSYFL